MHRDFPYDLVTLRDFEAGWGWDGQLNGYIRKKYRADLQGLTDLDPRRVAACLGGEIIAARPYAAVQWMLRLQPFRPLQVFFLFSRDPEVGPELRILYSRGSRLVPTEDAYVFGWDYLALLARYGRRAYPLEVGGPGAAWVSFDRLEAQAGGALEKYALTGRGEVLPAVSPEVAAVAILRLQSGSFQATAAGGWVVQWPVLPDLALCLEVNPASVSLAYDDVGAAKYGAEFLLSFAWLYINALLREARQVDATLPRLSRYF